MLQWVHFLHLFLFFCSPFCMLLHKVFFPFDRRRKKIELRYVVHIDKKKRRVFTDVGFSFVPLLHTQRIQEDNKRWADQSTSPKAKTQKGKKIVTIKFKAFVYVVKRKEHTQARTHTYKHKLTTTPPSPLRALIQCAYTEMHTTRSSFSFLRSLSLSPSLFRSLSHTCTHSNTTAHPRHPLIDRRKHPCVLPPWT